MFLGWRCALRPPLPLPLYNRFKGPCLYSHTMSIQQQQALASWICLTVNIKRAHDTEHKVPTISLKTNLESIHDKKTSCALSLAEELLQQ